MALIGRLAGMLGIKGWIGLGLIAVAGMLWFGWSAKADRIAELERALQVSSAETAVANAGIESAKRANASQQQTISDLKREVDRTTAALRQRAITEAKLHARSATFDAQLQEARSHASAEVQQCLDLPLPDDLLCLVRGACADIGEGDRGRHGDEGREGLTPAASPEAHAGARLRGADVRGRDRGDQGLADVSRALQRRQAGGDRLARAAAGVLTRPDWTTSL